MSSISAQGVVERASAELSKRINGLGLRSKHHKDHGAKTSVMERVTNVFCGGNNCSVTSSSSDGVEKPSRLLLSASRGKSTTVNGSTTATNTTRKNHLHTTTQFMTWEQIVMDDKFLAKFFSYFSAYERRTLAQVSICFCLMVSFIAAIHSNKLQTQLTH